MKKNTRSIPFCSILSKTALLLLALSYNSMLFACPNTITQLHIIEQDTAEKITHGLSSQTTTEGDELIETATGSIIN